MFSGTDVRFSRVLFMLVAFHVTVIAASNYLVQIPFQISGIHTTWGTFSFPLVYLATDLTVRVFGQVRARMIIFLAMIPALIVSYLVSILFFQGSFQGFGGLTEFNGFVFRIALASFIAYLSGQLLDVTVFSYLRKKRKWWVAPSVSTVVGNMLDTAMFYSAAFWRSSDEFMALHWPEIAVVDYLFKVVVSLLLFLPAYGLILTALTDAMVKGVGEKPQARQS